MVISISPKIFKMALDGNRKICHLIRNILSLIERGKHELIFENSKYINEIINSPEFISFREIIEMSMERSEERHSYHVLVRVTHRDLLKINLAQSSSYFEGAKHVEEKERVRCEYIDIFATESYLGEKLKIYLENAQKDGTFLKEMYYLVMKEYLNENLVEFRNGGGIRDIPNHLKAFRDPVRVICLVDSDKKFPEEETNNDIKEITEICNSKDFHLHILEKRMIENYLPDLILREWLIRKGKDSDHPYFEMNPQQKAYFNLKIGLSKGDLQEPQVKNLYESFLNCLDFKEDKILPGFERRISKLFENLSKKCSIFDLSSDTISEMRYVANLINQYT